MLVKQHNIVIDLADVEMESDCGILVHSILNDDPCATKADELSYGVNVIMTDMDVKGDLIHDDTTRQMWISLTSTQLEGAIRNANLVMDAGSKWTASADSSVTIIGTLDPAQIDAKEGVTITAAGGETGTYELASGGKLIVQA